MKKAIIGILPTIKLGKNDNPYDDQYTFVDMYSSRIIEHNAIPIGLLLKNGELNEDILNICDAFLLPGGNRIDKMHYKILEHAIKNNKPVLGICLGMQAIASYSYLKEIAINKNIDPTSENLVNLRKELQKENTYVLDKLEVGHIHGEKIMNEEIAITKKNLLDSTHSITIIPNTKLHECYKKSNINIISLHSYHINGIGADFKVSATAEDGIIEAIEYNNDTWIVGIQFHPEIEENNPIWKTFINEINKKI